MNAALSTEEREMYYIQKALKVSRKELKETMRMYNISAEKIAGYLRKNKQRFRIRHKINYPV